MTATAVPETSYDPTAAERAVRAVPKTRLREYAAYWRHLTTTNPDAVHRRWVYAFASVNANVPCLLSCYRFMLRFPRGFSAHTTEGRYVSRVRRAGVGGQFAVRAGGVYRFDRLYAQDCGRFAPRNPTPAVRDALAADLYGLGRAKTAFALELVDPLRCSAVCLDRHGLRLYGVPRTDTGAKVSDGFYEEAEAHWAAASRRRGFPPAIVRAAFWDMRFKMPTCRWWSFVFEPAFDCAVWAAGSAKTKW